MSAGLARLVQYGGFGEGHAARSVHQAAVAHERTAGRLHEAGLHAEGGNGHHQAGTRQPAQSLLQRRRQRLLDGLQHGLATLSDSDLRDYAGKGRDSLDEALQALVDGEVSVRAQLAGFESLAQELLAVDFDDRQAPEIERLRSALRSDAGVGAV